MLLFPGHGDGTFGPYKVLAAGTAFRHLAIQDVNHDGKPDITATTANVIEVFLGLGSGDFGPAHSHNFSSGRIDSLAFGDFDGDGKLDVAVGLYTPQTGANQVVSLRGRGDGTFLGAGQASPAGPGDAGSIAIEDFNGDGKLDVMVASVNIDQSFGGNSVSVLSGNGDGTFGPPVLYAVGSNPVAIALGTFNADGHVDAVTANMWSFDVTALLADSQGGFRAAKQYVAGPGAAVTLAGDLNGDKNTDLVVMTDSGFSVLLGTGKGAFQPGSNVAGPGGSAVLASFNDDQALDLAVNCGPNETGSLYLGNGDGTFSPPVGFVAANCGYVINADLNRDGKQDLVSANLGEVVTVLLGAGAGYFQPPAYYAVGNGRGGGRTVAIADLDGDGHLDLVASNPGQSTLTILHGTGDGTFARSATIATGPLPRFVRAADLNGDGKSDLVVGSDGMISVYLNNGHGGFLKRVDYPVDDTVLSISAKDLNGDGVPDIVVADSSSIGIKVFMGVGNGSFAARRDYHATADRSSLVVADFNHDGFPDIAVTSPFTGTVTVLLSTLK